MVIQENDMFDSKPDHVALASGSHSMGYRNMSREVNPPTHLLTGASKEIFGGYRTVRE